MPTPEQDREERDWRIAALLRDAEANVHLAGLLHRQQMRERYGTEKPHRNRSVTLATAPLLEREGEHEAR